MSRSDRLPVWNLALRALHWSLVAGIAASWITSSSTSGAHEIIGYAVAAVVAARVLLGLAGGRYARFSQFVRPPRATLAYLRQVLARRAPRYIGHNPLGGWMVLALLAAVALSCLSGWIATTDAFWGYALPVQLHVAAAWTVVGLAALHVAGVILTSLEQRENLVRAMLTGKKDQPRPGDID